MSWIEKINDIYRVKFREKISNPLLGGTRKSRLDNPQFTIISNNCWGGHVYRYFGMPYNSPTVGLYFFTDEYIKFLSRLKEYIEMDLKFIPCYQSKYYKELVKRKETNKIIGLLGDVEIVFLHYKTEAEAIVKWKRRCSRIQWNHLIVKMTEQNLCSLSALQAFDRMPFDVKMVFTSNNYSLQSQVIFGDYFGKKEVSNDTLHFRKYVDLVKLINGKSDFRRNQPSWISER